MLRFTAFKLLVRSLNLLKDTFIYIIEGVGPTIFTSSQTKFLYWSNDQLPSSFIVPPMTSCPSKDTNTSVLLTLSPFTEKS